MCSYDEAGYGERCGQGRGVSGVLAPPAGAGLELITDGHV
jgi:hypothetical protein